MKPANCLFPLFIVALLSSGCNKHEGPGTSDLTLNKETLSLAVGEQAQLTVQGADAVSWTSDLPEVAAVDNKGQVSALSAGQARITASAQGRSAVCVVTAFRREEYTASSAEELAEAVAKAQGTEEHPARIVLTGDITINNTGEEQMPVVIGDDAGAAAKYICLDGDGHYRISAIGWGATMLKVTSGSRLILQNITLDGGGITSVHPIISVQDAELVLAEGAELCNLKNSLSLDYYGSINLEGRSVATLKTDSAIRDIEGVAVFVDAVSAHARIEGGTVAKCGISAFLLYRSNPRDNVPLLIGELPEEAGNLSLSMILDPRNGRHPVARGLGETVLQPENFTLSKIWDHQGRTIAASLEENGGVIEISPEQ